MDNINNKKHEMISKEEISEKKLTNHFNESTIEKLKKINGIINNSADVKDKNGRTLCVKKKVVICNSDNNPGYNVYEIWEKQTEK